MAKYCYKQSDIIMAKYNFVWRVRRVGCATSERESEPRLVLRLTARKSAPKCQSLRLTCTLNRYSQCNGLINAPLHEIRMCEYDTMHPRSPMEDSVG